MYLFILLVNILETTYTFFNYVFLTTKYLISSILEHFIIFIILSEHSMLDIYVIWFYVRYITKFLSQCSDNFSVSIFHYVNL